LILFRAIFKKVVIDLLFVYGFRTFEKSPEGNSGDSTLRSRATIKNTDFFISIRRAIEPVMFLNSHVGAVGG